MTLGWFLALRLGPNQDTFESVSSSKKWRPNSNPSCDPKGSYRRGQTPHTPHTDLGPRLWSLGTEPDKSAVSTGIRRPPW